MNSHQGSGLEHSTWLHRDRLLTTTVRRTSKMPDRVLFPRKWVRVLFKMWQGIIKAEKNNYLVDTVQELELQVRDLQEQVEVLQDQIQPETSIWRMKKEQLVEVAIEELSLTRSEAKKSNLESLRQRIKQSRDMLKTTEDPLAVKPVGFGKMSREELVRQMEMRNLAMPQGMSGHHRACTRGFMKVAIEEDIAQRLILSGREVPQTQADLRETPGMSSTSGTANNETEWMTINTPREQAMDTDVPRATSRRRNR